MSSNDPNLAKYAKRIFCHYFRLSIPDLDWENEGEISGAIDDICTSIYAEMTKEYRDQIAELRARVHILEQRTGLL